MKTRTADILTDLTALAGFIALETGLFMVDTALGLVAGGSLMIAAALYAGRPGHNSRKNP